MANPALSQANFDLRWKRHAVILAMWRSIKELRERFGEEKVRVLNDKDFNDNFAIGSLILRGVDLGVNTSIYGELFVRLVANSSNWDIHLYKATGGGGGDEVAEAIDIADAAAFTLTAVNSSGITGSGTLGASVTAETNDVHRLICLPDMKLQINSAWNKAIDRDGDMERAALDAAAAIERQLRSLELSVINLYEEFVRRQLGPAVKSTSQTMLNREARDDDGAIEVAFTGMLEDLRLGMVNNDTGSAVPQKVVKAAVSAAAVAYQAGNVGAGTTPTPTLYEYQEGGTWTGRCVDATIGAQRFSMSFAPSDPARAHLTFTSPRPLQVKREWKEPGEGASSDGRARVGVRGLTIDYARTITNTSGTGLSTTAGDWSETGESESNTDSGVLYVSVATNGAAFDISFYSDSNKPASSLVAKATSVAANAAFTATERNSSGLTIFGKSHASIANGNTSTVDLNVFDTDGRADGAPDRFDFVVTETSIGHHQEFAAEALGYYLHSDTAGSETVSEAYAIRGSTALALNQEI